MFDYDTYCEMVEECPVCQVCGDETTDVDLNTGLCGCCERDAYQRTLETVPGEQVA